MIQKMNRGYSFVFRISILFRISRFGFRLLLLSCLSALGCQNSRTPGTPPETPVVTTKSGIEMVFIPAGSFEMGSRQGRDDEKPLHTVSVDSFLMDRHEVTQAEYEKLGKLAEPPFPNPSHFKGQGLPVEQVTWPQAARFCNVRSRIEGLTPCYNEDTAECDFNAGGYRLPTEAEWEYACRAGTNTEYSYGNESRILGDFAWFGDNASRKTHPVAQKRPNPWGLCDMHGNVAEWCQDVFDKTYYQTSPEKSPRGPADGKEYALRGGSWKSPAEALRSSYRLGETPGFSDACLARDAIGFRCVRKAPSSSNEKNSK
jgi:formylglycine-generating enzyme required for sulfatase activity